MKGFIKLALTLTLVVGAAATYASDTAYAATFCKMVAEDEKTYRLIYQGATEGNVSIQFFNTKGDLVHSEQVKASKGFIKKFDLTYLPQAEYVVEVTAPDFRYTETVSTFSATALNLVFSPMEGRQIALVGFDKYRRDLTLYVLDERRDVVYKETLTKSDSIQRKYNLQGFRGNKVIFVLYHGDRMLQEKEFGL